VNIQKEKGVNYMDICLVYYESYNGTVTAEDHYIPWAISLLEEGCMSPALNMLAGLQKPYNIFEVEEYVQRTIRELTLFVPTYEQCIAYKAYHHLVNVTYKPSQSIKEAKILIDMAFKHDDTDYLQEWIAISQLIDEFEYDNKHFQHTEEKIQKEITSIARQELDKVLEKSSQLSSHLTSYKRY